MSDELSDTWAEELVNDLEVTGALDDGLLAAIQRATDRASDAPWTPMFGNGPSATVLDDNDREFVDVEGGNRENDTAFIAIARSAVPLLINEIERLREDLRAYIDADNLALDGLLALARQAAAEGDERWLERIEYWLLPQDETVLADRELSREATDD